MLSYTWSLMDNVYYTPKNGVPLYFEYVSKYRRVTVVGIGRGFELRVNYKGIAVKDWSRSYGDIATAMAWAKVQADNREITTGSLTIREAIGVVKIPLPVS